MTYEEYKVRFIFDNHVARTDTTLETYAWTSDSGDIAGNLTVGAPVSPVPTMPVENVQTTLKKETTRMSDTSNFMIRINLARLQKISGIAVLYHNLTGGGKFRAQVNNTNTATTVYDSGAQPAGQLVPWGSEPWGMFTWGATEEFGDRVSHWWFDYVVGNQIDLFVSDAVNPDGYNEIGTVWIGSDWSPEENFMWGAGLGQTDNSTTQRAQDSSLLIQKNIDFRHISVSFHSTSNDAATFTRTFEQLGKSLFFASFFPASTNLINNHRGLWSLTDSKRSQKLMSPDLFNTAYNFERN